MWSGCLRIWGWWRVYAAKWRKIWEMLLLFQHSHDIIKFEEVSATRNERIFIKAQAQRNPVYPEQHRKKIRSVTGTMAIEGLTLSDASRRDLERYASGQASFRQIMAELIAKYQRAE